MKRLSFAFSLSFLFVFCVAQSCVAQHRIQIQWHAGPSLPQAVGGHMAVWHAGELFVIGGTNWKDGVKSTFVDVWIYSPQRKSWRRAPSLPRPVAYGVAKSTFNGIEIDGGWDHNQALKDVYTFSFKNKQWQRKADLPAPLAYAGGGMIQGKYFLAGGAADMAKDESYNSFLWQHDTDHWQNISPIPTPLVLFAYATTKQGIYLFGGMNYQKMKAHNLAEARYYDVKNNTWKSLRPLPVAARGMAACAVSEKYILLAGGYADHYLNQVLLYDVKKDTYTSLNPLPYAVMGFQMVYANRSIYLTGGEDAPRHRSSHFFIGEVQGLS